MKVITNFDLTNLNTFHVKASAKYFASFQNVDDLRTAIKDVSEADKIVLGGGSNVLLTRDIDGLVLHNRIPGIEIVNENEEEIWIKAGAGVIWHDLVMYSVSQNLGGIENLSLIPGYVGASPMQNIGAYGVEIKDVFHQLEAFHIEDKVIQKFSGKDCRFGYRDSIFKGELKGQFAILNVTLRLQKRPVFNISYGTVSAQLESMGVRELNVKSISDAIISIRRSKLPDPSRIGNAGSFFKNPVINSSAFEHLVAVSGEVPFYAVGDDFKVPAAWLIEQCGFKGFRAGQVGCYEKQPLVLVNYGGASGKDIYELSEKIIESVYERFSIRIEREVNII